MKTSMKVRNYLILSATTTTNQNAPYLNLQFRKRKKRVKVSCVLLHVVQENRVRTHARTHTHTHTHPHHQYVSSVCVYVCAHVSLQNRCVRRAHGMLFTPRANKFSAPRRHATMTTGDKQWRRRKFQPTAG